MRLRRIYRTLLGYRMLQLVSLEVLQDHDHLLLVLTERRQEQEASWKLKRLPLMNWTLGSS